MIYWRLRIDAITSWMTPSPRLSSIPIWKHGGIILPPKLPRRSFLSSTWCRIAQNIIRRSGSNIWLRFQQWTFRKEDETALIW